MRMNANDDDVSRMVSCALIGGTDLDAAVIAVNTPQGFHSHSPGLTGLPGYPGSSIHVVFDPARVAHEEEVTNVPILP
jgi:hypothetical protein